MEKQDLRKLDDNARELLRKRGIAMMESNMLKKDIVLVLGVHVNTVTYWRKRYEPEGAKGLKGPMRGKGAGACSPGNRKFRCSG